MSKNIQKLNRLKNPESFLQVNTIKGFKYIDKAGEIVNSYHIKNKVPIFEMNLNGLLIIKPTEKIDELKITPQAIWAKSTEVDSLDMISRIFSEEAIKIIKILDIQEISRIGWRNFFIFDFNNQNDQKEFFKKLSSVKNINLVSAKFDLITGKNFKANLNIEPLVKKKEPETYSALFDIDVYQLNKLEVNNIHKILKEFREYLNDEKGFLEVLNNTFC